MSTPAIENGPYRDGLLWIGRSYRYIRCGSAENCAKPADERDLEAARGQARCFVHEAEWRGISRKVPAVPGWVVPGESRIFLVHSDGLAPHHGRIFGYFVVARREALSSSGLALAAPDVQRELPWKPPENGEADEAADDLGALTVDVRDTLTGRPLGGARVRAIRRSAEHEARRDGLHYQLVLPPGPCRLSVSMPTYGDTEIEGVQVRSRKRRKLTVHLLPEGRQGSEGDERTRRCPDGSEIVTHRWHDGRWVETGERCPEAEDPPECTEGEVELTVCPDGGIIPVRICRGGEWIDTGARCPDGPPGPTPPGPTPPGPTPPGPTPPGPGPDQPPPDLHGPDVDVEIFAPHRSCSLRLQPRAAYLVDALCAEINDTFAQEVRRADLPGRYRQARTDDQRWKLVLEGRRIFRSVAGRISGAWTPTTRIPPEVAVRSSLHGELVLFADPPMFTKTPRAAFRGLEHIDGDHLLAQIEEGVAEPAIRVYVAPGEDGAALTRRQVEAALAGPEHVSLTTVHDLLDRLADQVAKRLDAHGSISLPHIGTLRPAGCEKVRSLNRRTLEKQLVESLPTYSKKVRGKDGKERTRILPVLRAAEVHRLLDRLGELADRELRRTERFRIPHIGTLERRGGTTTRFRPSTRLPEPVEFVP